MIGNIQAYTVNAFTDKGSGGSPTTVVFHAGTLTDGQMQRIANTVNTSHTAFVDETLHSEGKIIVRFFTPGGEIANCGHGTIAAHYARVNHLHITGNHTVIQEAKTGTQKVEIIQQGDEVEIYVHQDPIQFLRVTGEQTKELLDALHINIIALNEEYPPVLASPGTYRFLIAVQEEYLDDIQPDFEKLKNVCSRSGSMGCLIYSITNKNPESPEVTARMFAPNIGVNEDIINGNSSSCLGAYLLTLNNKEHVTLNMFQGHLFNQRGLVRVKAANVNGQYETVIGGTACITKTFEINYQ